MKYSKNKHRSLSHRRKVGRILLLCAMGLAILLSVLVLGNLLHDRLEQAAPLLKLPTVTYGDFSAPETSPPTPALSPARTETDTDGIFCTIDDAVLAGDPAQLREACSIAAELYDGLSVTVSAENGLRYSLDGTASDFLLPAEQWAALTDAASACTLTVCAVWYLPDEVPGTDSETCRLVRILASSGADEILFTGLTSASLRAEDQQAMTALCQAVRDTGSDVKIGFALLPEVFADVDSAPQLDLLCTAADFLAVDLREPSAGDPDGASHALTAAEKLYGSIPYYRLRLLIRGSTGKIAAQSAALRQAGYTAVQPLS